MDTHASHPYLIWQFERGSSCAFVRVDGDGSRVEVSRDAGGVSWGDLCSAASCRSHCCFIAVCPWPRDPPPAFICTSVRTTPSSARGPSLCGPDTHTHTSHRWHHECGPQVWAMEYWNCLFWIFVFWGFSSQSWSLLYKLICNINITYLTKKMHYKHCMFVLVHFNTTCLNCNLLL